MARIRTIKPEFYASESVGRLSRDARLLFIGLWSFADDSGRGRGALPAISGAIFPYDPDALGKLDRWISELEREGMVRRYRGPDGNLYYDIPKWLEHQRIEKPSQSKFPPFTEPYRNIPGVLPECSPLDQGSGIRDQGTGSKDQGSSVACATCSPEELDVLPRLMQAEMLDSAAPAAAILSYLNEKSGRSFEAVHANLAMIKARIKEVSGDLPGVRLMIDRQCALWKADERMAPYLRPATLFNRSKFRSYYDDRNQPIANARQGSSGPRPGYNRNAFVAGSADCDAPDSPDVDFAAAPDTRRTPDQRPPAQ